MMIREIALIIMKKELFTALVYYNNYFHNKYFYNATYVITISVLLNSCACFSENSFFHCIII